jgi:dihydroflavonol-4-reductase
VTAVDKVLVTGASGFVGSAVARRLVEERFAVRALVRAGSPRAHLEDLKLEFVEGDLRDAAAVRQAMRGVRYVFHVAAVYRLSLRNPQEIFASNFEGTRIVMQAARCAGVERIVHTSSVATLAPRADGAPADESILVEDCKAVSAYKRSKLAAERLVHTMIAEGLPAVVVNPSTPIGPFDVRPTPTGRIVVEAAAGRIPGFVDTGLNLVHVDDVAAGHLAALRHGVIGARYILGGQNVHICELLREITRRAGRPAPRWRIPRLLVLPFAAAAECAARVTGHEPFVTINGVRLAKHRMFFTSAKAEQELGYSPRPYTEGIEDALRWFRRHGYLPG